MPGTMKIFNKLFYDIIICMFIHNTFSFIFNIILLARATDTLLDIQMF